MNKNRLLQLLTVAFSFILQVNAQTQTSKPTPTPTPKTVPVQTPTPTPKTTPTPVVEDDGEILKVYSRLVVVPVAVTDNLGQPILNLTKNDFRLDEEGTNQQIEQLSKADEVPLEIAVLIDVSDSVNSMFDFEKSAAAKFLRSVLKPEDRATIFLISDRPILSQPYESAEISARAIEKIMPTKNQTAFYDTVAVAGKYLKANALPKSRRVVLAMTDGEDNWSQLTQKAQITAAKNVKIDLNNLNTKTLAAYKEAIRAETEKAHQKAQTVVLRELQNADTVFYSINPAGNSYQLNSISVRAQNAMQKFADETGGTAFLPKKSDDLTLIFKQITNELRAQYLLQYYSDTDYPDSKYVKIKVGLPNQTKLRVRSRQGFFSVKQ